MNSKVTKIQNKFAMDGIRRMLQDAINKQEKKRHKVIQWMLNILEAPDKVDHCYKMLTEKERAKDGH